MPKIKTVRERTKFSNFRKVIRIMRDDEERYGFIISRKQVKTDTDGYTFEERIYCPKCKNGFVFAKNARRTCRDEPDSYTCPDCGITVPAEDCIDIYVKAGVINKFLIWIEVIDDDPDGPFVKLKWISQKISGWNDKIQIENVYYYILFNTESGQSYYFEPYVKPEGSNIGRRAPWYDGPKMKNISYGRAKDLYETNDIPLEIYKELYDKIYAKISKKLGYSPKPLPEYFKEEDVNDDFIYSINGNREEDYYTLLYICLYNRQPNLNPKRYSDLVNNHFNPVCHRDTTLAKYAEPILENEDVTQKKRRVKRNTGYKYKPADAVLDRRIASIKSNDCDPVGTLMKAYGIPNIKSFRKYILKSYNYIDDFRIGTLLFKDVNNIRKFVENNRYYGYREAEKNKFLLSFNKRMIEKFTEKVWVDKIGRRFSTLADTAEMYEKAKGKVLYQVNHENTSTDFYSREMADEYINNLQSPELASIVEVRPVLDLNGTVQEIHDNLSEYLSRFRQVNKTLTQNYTKDMLNLEEENDKYIIRFARDTYELKDVGKEMHICVGNLYSERAFEKTVNIMLMIEKETNKYVVCMEMNPEATRVFQAKETCNKFVSEDRKDYVCDWIKRNKLHCNTTDIAEVFEGYYKDNRGYEPDQNQVQRAMDHFNGIKTVREVKQNTEPEPELIAW